MNLKHFVMIAMLVWGNLSFASLPTSTLSERQELQTISSWMAHLNFYYPELALAPAQNADLNNPSVRQEMLQDLNVLENLVGGASLPSLPKESLKQIACDRPQCTGGGGGGKCSSCSAD